MVIRNNLNRLNNEAEDLNILNNEAEDLNILNNEAEDLNILNNEAEDEVTKILFNYKPRLNVYYLVKDFKM